MRPEPLSEARLTLPAKPVLIDRSDANSEAYNLRTLADDYVLLRDWTEGLTQLIRCKWNNQTEACGDDVQN